MNGLILIVEDDKKMIESLELALRKQYKDVRICAMAFAGAAEFVKRELPDLIILDLFLDGVTDKGPAATPTAQPTWEVVWSDHFCPVIIHSGKDVAEYKNCEHPYVRYEAKGVASIGRVIGHVTQFAPQTDRFRALRLDFSKRAGEALKATSRLLAEKENLTEEQQEVVLRSAKRRVAASFDDVDKQEYGWERYVFPPLSKDFLMGDILLEKDKPKDKADSYRIILTPSCDLVPGRTGSVSEVLLASCCAFEKFSTAAQMPEAADKIRKRLPKELSRDQVGGYVPLPGIPGLFPTMCVDLRALSLVSLETLSVKQGEGEFSRVAGMDSPFREKLMWAFVQIAGRPATPELDTTKLVEEVIANGLMKVSGVAEAKAPAATKAKK